MTPAPPPCIGLTGGIGSGKSAALRAFSRRGAAVLSADDVVHALYRDPEVIAAVASRFGADVLDADGQVDRAALGSRAMGEEGGIAFLEQLLHPRIGRARDEWISRERALLPPPPLLVCEVPLLFEVGLQDHFDEVLVVTAPTEVRRARVEARGQDFDARASMQWDEDRKVGAANAWYVNDGTEAALDAWVGVQFHRLVADGAG